MRHSSGGVRKQRGRWYGLWYEEGKKKSVILGLVKDMTKGEAREAIAERLKAMRQGTNPTRFGPFVEGPYLKVYLRKWKPSTAENNQQRLQTHLVSEYRDRDLQSFNRDELQTFLDRKATTLSFSVVDHLRWDLRQIFTMAIAEGFLARNPAALLFTPKTASRPVRLAMTIEQVRLCFSVLGQRERLIAKLAILGGMRPGEIFGLRWDRLTVAHADIQQRVYRRVVDTPKTQQSYRKAAIAQGLARELEEWRMVATDPDGWVFPSERLYELKDPKPTTPMSKDNCWRRNMLPRLQTVGLEWCNFQVMRRTHTTIMRQLGADPLLVAQQCGHSLDTSMNVYAQSSVESRLLIVNQLEQTLAATMVCK